MKYTLAHIILPACLLAIASPAFAVETATATVALQSISGPTSTYKITLKDTGTTDIGTFWYAWTPVGYNFLHAAPTVTSSPTGWTGGINPGFGGYSIEWTGTPIHSGDTVSFGFSTIDSLAAITGNSIGVPGNNVGTSYIYTGGPFSDNGGQIMVTAAPVPEAASLSLLALGVPMLLRRRKRHLAQS